ncbi:hypothetical protein [Luteolibacter sp. LG18]|uniref:hypothetical protein n=1 Tax=Luteolibacter sp. LG18 TaxID=2819286 RepID=UPI002B3054A0|nr:hypothetical protein llg_15840 [Luteolibacter sp. LG18]
MARPKKVHHFKLKPHKNAAGSQSWQVTGTTPDGTRIRQNFQDKADALQRVADLEQEIVGKGDSRRTLKTALSPEQVADAETAFGQLGGSGLSKAISHYLNLRAKAEEKGVSLDQAIAFFEARYRPEIREITILNAKQEFLETRRGIRASTRSNYDIGLGLLLKKDPNAFVHSFTVGDLEKILKGYTNVQSQRSFRTIFSVFFGWAVRHHYCLENPCERFDKLPKNMSQIAALSLNECKRLLYAAVTYQGGKAAACVAIGLFAGLRPSELQDLEKESIQKERIRVVGGKLRRKIKRSAPIPPVLAAWLEKFPFEGVPKGWSSKLKTLKKATKAKKWVADIIRHTSITFQAERDKNEALTAYNNGTSKEMMDRHYRNVIDEEETIREFWNLTPEALLKASLSVELPVKFRIDWPDKKALKALVWEKPLIHAAKDIGVSDVTLKKHCLALGIVLPSRGHWLARSGS